MQFFNFTYVLFNFSQCFKDVLFILLARIRPNWGIRAPLDIVVGKMKRNSRKNCQLFGISSRSRANYESRSNSIIKKNSQWKLNRNVYKADLIPQFKTVYYCFRTQLRLHENNALLYVPRA